MSVLVFVLAVVAVITLEPFTFRVPTVVEITYWASGFDVVANVILFVPAGFLFALTRAATAHDATSAAARRETLRRAAWLAAFASTAIEITQVFEPTRYPSPLDIVANVAGGVLGAWLHTRAARRLDAGTALVGRLALELPLMGLVYIMLPLLTLAALTAGAAPAVLGSHIPLPRAWGLLALALFGGTILGHVQRRHFGPGRMLTPRQVALVAAGWFGIGALPAVATAPIAFAAGAVVAAIAAWAHGAAPDGISPINRRFEGETLARAVPWLVAYLALVPLTDAAAPASLHGKLDLLRRVESLTGFTILGYVLAEAWGRFEMRYRWTAWRVAAVAILAIALAEVLRRMSVPSVTVIPLLAAHVVAAAYGGWIYHLQRAHIRELVAARRASAAPSTARVATGHAGPARGGSSRRVYPFPGTERVRAAPRATTRAPDARSGGAIRRLT